ncbi:MAG: hypothetical protein U0744_01435 [Gemmataceae bacterium]
MIDRLLQDLEHRQPPLWRRTPSALPTIGLAQAICDVLADRCRVSLEDPPETSPKKGLAPR